MEADDILNLIRENEDLQRQIIDDPMLREKLYERFNGMKHSASDFTLPHSQWSSKHIGERRTQGQTNLFHTPLRSDEGKDLSEFNNFLCCVSDHKWV